MSPIMLPSAIMRDCRDCRDCRDWRDCRDTIRNASS